MEVFGGPPTYSSVLLLALYTQHSRVYEFEGVWEAQSFEHRLSFLLEEV